MGQQGEAGHIACCKHTGNVGAHLFIYLDAIAQQLHSQVLQAESLCNRSATHTQQDLLTFHAVGFTPFFKNDFVARNLHHLCIQVEGNSFFCIDVTQHGRHLEVETAQYFGKHLHHRHFRPQAIIEAGELHANHPAANDDQ